MADPAAKLTQAAPPSAGEAADAVSQAQPISPQIQEVLDKMKDPEVRAMMSIALSRTSFGFGPDPETAKILAETEMHEENCRLQGYTASLQNKDKQNERDHDFRKRRLNREFSMALAVLILGAAGACVGLYLVAAGNSAIGSNILIASIGVILYVLKGNTDVFRAD